MLGISGIFHIILQLFNCKPLIVFEIDNVRKISSFGKMKQCEQKHRIFFTIKTFVKTSLRL